MTKLFKGIGKYQFWKITLNIDKDVKPIIQPQQRIPFAKREKLDEVNNEIEKEMKFRKSKVQPSGYSISY